ncbi:MAG TPA: hypothetical protein VK932_18610 [Kofleriaceae bacterium]|nr:hypothetical protein [Kofleriaceae bacterium]
MYEKTWPGDWHARILERVQRRGFSTVTQYTSDRIGVSLVDLATELGSDDVAGIQIMYMLIEEATRTNAVPRLLRDLFVRELREHLPNGWRYPLDEESRFEVIGALVDWEVELRQTEIRDHFDREATLEARKAFLNAELPAGWIPDGPDDPVIVAFVDRCLGRVPS